MRHIVTVTHQVRAIGNDRWVTDGLRIYGPFYTPFTGRDFARKVAHGAIRLRYTMSERVTLSEDKGVFTLTEWPGRHRRTLISTSAIQPSSVRAAWRFIRDWHMDQPVPLKRKVKA